MQALKMKYRSPASDDNQGWEQYSLPLGCGHFGANVFGLVQRERIQITENSVFTKGNLTNACEIYLHFPHSEVSEYERGLILNKASVYCRYTSNDVLYTREYFTSYPDNVMVVKLTADKPGALTFTLAPEIPFLHPFGDKTNNGAMGKTAKIKVTGNTIEIDSKLEYYAINFSAQFRIETDGIIKKLDEALSVNGASEAFIYFSCGTNYVLGTRVFNEKNPRNKLEQVNPRNRIFAIVEAAANKGYEKIKADHEKDFCSIFDRVSLDIESSDGLDDLPTDELLEQYQAGKKSAYLETLYYQYGRYLLISSSRNGCLPANLQGIWSCHQGSPWGSGYWHNINVQMNYWPVFSTNMAELFSPYCDLNMAFREKAEDYAVEYIRKHNPENYKQGDDCGWCIGTAVYPYEAGGAPGGHSGPGTGGLTTKMYWDYWDFTRDYNILYKEVYPTLLSMSRFLTRTVRKCHDNYLSSFSASPEQMLSGKFVSKGTYYHTVGCAFDQQMLYENGKDTLSAASILKCEDEATQALTKQIDSYSPVEIGWSGQIKEYREENYYGEIGEYNHRHISQLVALMPGTLITSKTPAWMDAAKVTLNERSDESTGWALAHRLNAWARVGDGDRSYLLLRNLLGTRTLPNLWDTHPPFQIDGNFGATSGITEMLLQSHAGYIDILPALPSAWKTGRFQGLVARGNFIVGASWKDGNAVQISITANKGGRVCVRYPQIANGQCINDRQTAVDMERLSDDRVVLDTEVGGTYTFKAIPSLPDISEPSDIQVDADSLTVSWKCSEPELCYNVYRNTQSRPVYEKISDKLKNLSFTDDSCNFSEEDYITYKVTACLPDGSCETNGPTKTICHASKLYKERYLLQIKVSSQVVKNIEEL